MLYTKNYRDSLILKYNVDSQGNPVSIKIEDEKSQVSTVNFTIHLMQIPDEVHRLKVVNPDGMIMHEVFDVEKIGKDNYKVDYAHGIVYFHPDNAGKIMTVTYAGRGVELVYAGRILMDTDIPGETLGDLTDRFQQAYDTLKDLQDLIDGIKQDYADWEQIVFDDNPLLALQTQIKLLNADSLDHVRWRLNSKQDGILADTGAFIKNNEDKYIQRGVKF